MRSHLIRTVVGLCLLTLATTASAQYRKDQAAWPVTVGGDTLELPFLGGLNDPKPVLLDYDDDSLTDLLIGQRDGRLIYLRNVGSLSQPSWQATSERLGELDIGTWFTFADIDADGDFDLFCDSRAGSVAFYRNDIGPGATSFTLIDTAFGGFNTGINNTPTFADIDGDGDLDYFFGILTGWLEYWENVGDSTNYSFTFVTDRYDSILAFPGGGGQRNPQHGFSAVRFADIDSDNDLDLFWGDINNLKMYHFENLGNSSLSDLTLATEHFLPVATIGFNHPAFADMDADTDLDMLVGVANGADIDNLRMFLNDGTPTAPSYVQASTNYIDNIDFGSNSMPTLGDLDGDGDLDLLVGGILGTLAHFENVGSASQPSFKLISTQFQSIDVGFSAAPVLVDWDNDTDLDLLIGTQSGKIEYWRNDGSVSNFVAVQVTNQLAGIKVDQLAIPAVADLNGDNLIDLLVGEWDFNSFANVILYRNVGSPGAPLLELHDSKLLNLDSMAFALPYIYDWDGDGRDDILIAEAGSGLTLYKNSTNPLQFPDSTTLIEQVDTIPGWDDGNRVSLAIADMDADGDADIIFGEEYGGLNVYVFDGNCCVGTRGDFNGDSADLDIVDLTCVVDFLFGSGCIQPCSLEADPNGDSSVSDIVDLTFVVDWLFGTAPTLVACP